MSRVFIEDQWALEKQRALRAEQRKQLEAQLVEKQRVQASERRRMELEIIEERRDLGLEPLDGPTFDKMLNRRQRKRGFLGDSVETVAPVPVVQASSPIRVVPEEPQAQEPQEPQASPEALAKLETMYKTLLADHEELKTKVEGLEKRQAPRRRRSDGESQGLEKRQAPRRRRPDGEPRRTVSAPDVAATQRRTRWGGILDDDEPPPARPKRRLHAFGRSVSLPRRPRRRLSENTDDTTPTSSSHAPPPPRKQHHQSDDPHMDMLMSPPPPLQETENLANLANLETTTPLGLDDDPRPPRSDDMDPPSSSPNAPAVPAAMSSEWPTPSDHNPIHDEPHDSSSNWDTDALSLIAHDAC